MREPTEKAVNIFFTATWHKSLEATSAVSAYLCDLCVKRAEFDAEIAEIRRDRRGRTSIRAVFHSTMMAPVVFDLIGIIPKFGRVCNVSYFVARHYAVAAGL